ncbi:MAG: hypothetical protein GY757_56910 [bacterium]|nr:hypothetical protein [bacterium]
MKNVFIIILCIVGLSVFTFGETGFKGRAITDNVSAPTGYTLNKGEFEVGLGHIGFGISDKVQVSTNVLLYLFQDFNASLKVSLIKNKKNAFAVGCSIHSFDLSVFSNEDVGFTAILPYVAYSTKISPKTKMHFTGQYSHFSGSEDIADATAKATSNGTSVTVGIEHSFSNKTKFLAETGYDLTFKGFRVGGAVLWGWKKFRLKLGINYFSPEGTDGFILPLVSLWWRFKG